MWPFKKKEETNENSKGMIPVQVRLTDELIKKVDSLVEKGVYPNRSEAVRDAVRQLK